MVQPSGKVMKNEQFAAYGRLSTHVVRMVKVQYKSGNKWKTKASGPSSGGGYFGFNISTSKSRTFRYYAPKSGSRAAIEGHARRIKVVSQKVSQFIVTPNVRCDFAAGDVTMLVRFYPPRSGRDVKFDTNTGVKLGQQDGHGVAAVTFDAGTDAFVYNARARTVASDGATGKRSGTYRYQVKSCL